MHIRRAADAPSREGLSWVERWEAADDGLIATWEAGRQLAARRPDLAVAAKAGELVELPWKGGLTRALEPGARKFGSLLYVAMWHGLRGEALDMDTETDLQLTCTRFGTSVTFTAAGTRVGLDDIS